jgi:hypothetical protein
VPYSFTDVPWLRIGGYRFGFFSREPVAEPPHIHVVGNGGSAKVFLEPVRIVRSTYTRTVTRDIERLIRRNKDLFVAMWHARHVQQ